MQARIILPLLLSVTTISSARAEDWPQWRGVNRDAIIADSDLVESLPTGTLERKWEVEIGPGYSGPTIAEGRVYVTDRGPNDSRADIERVLCFDAENGLPIWEDSYPAPYTIGYKAGPRASVTVDKGLAISIGAMGHLRCYDAAEGELRWQHDLSDEYSIRMPVWGITASPLVYGDTVIQIVGGAGDACVVAFDLATGEERWRAIDEPAGYSAPILIRQGGQDVLVCWTGASVTGLDPSSGTTYWSIPMLPRNMPIGVPTPVVQDDLLFVSSFYDGSMLIRLDQNKPAAEMVYHRIGADEQNTDALHCMIGTPIIKGDHIYGVDSYGELRCLDLKTGDRVWEDLTAVPRARWATIHIIRNGDREILFNDQGDLIYATLAPDGYHEQSRTKLIAPTRKQLNRRDGVAWAHPAIANGNIYIRNDDQLICASLRK